MFYGVEYLHTAEWHSRVVQAGVVLDANKYCDAWDN